MAVRNFRRVMTGIDVKPLLAQVAANPQLWNVDEAFRRAKGPDNVLFAQDNIILRYMDPTPPNMPKKYDREAFSVLAAAQDIVFNLMRAVRGEHLGPVVISRMVPGEVIKPHIDHMPFIDPNSPWLGRYLPYVQRYQIPLYVRPGVQFICGSEEVSMEPGEAWWFNNQMMHSVLNYSDHDRITLRCDIRPWGGDPWRV